MKKYLLVLLVFVSSAGFAQKINDYKYVIIPSKFSFLKEKDQYRMNTLTRLYLEKYGFITYFDTDVLPVEVANQNCNIAHVDLLSDGSLFVTKLTVVLKGCRNEILFTSADGKSREKEYQVAYTHALREAFKSFDQLGYKYNGTGTDNETKIVKTTNSVTPVTQETEEKKENTDSSKNTVLFAQPIENGFQLIDSTPKVILKIAKTSDKDLFIAENNLGKGVLYLKNENWIFEYYASGKLTSEVFKIKF